MNQKGFSLLEICIVLGLTGIVSLGAMKIITDSKNRESDAEKLAERTAIEKILEGYFISEEGCNYLKGKSVGSPIAFNKGPISIQGGTKLGNIIVTSININDFIATDTTNVRGLLQLKISLNKDGRNVDRKFNLPVSMQTVGGTQVVESCRMSKSLAIDKILYEVCGTSFGALTSGLTCVQAKELVRRMMIQEICNEVSSSHPHFNGIHCNLNLIHSNKSCGGGKVVGFDANGNLICG